MVLLVVALAVAVMRRRASAHLLSWLWLLPLVPLVLPLDRVMPEVSSPAMPTRVILAWLAPSDWARVPEAGRVEREPESRLPSTDAVPREAAPLPLRRASDQSLAAAADPGVVASLEGRERDAWRASLLAALEPKARDGSSGGIWPLVDAWSRPGPEVYATATCLRTLCAIL